MHKYRFVGKILPETQTFPDIDHTFDLKQTDVNLDCQIRLKTTSNDILVEIESNSEILDILSLRNYVKDAIILEVSIYGYLHGCYHEVLIYSFDNLETGQEIWFNTTIQEISNTQERPFTSPADLLELFATPESQFLREALEDMISSIRNSKYTGFHCFRMMESIRKYFYELVDDAGKGWNALYSELNIHTSVKIELEKLASEPRHGQTIFLSNEMRIKIVKIAWQIMDRYLLYLKSGKKTVDKEKYPLLKWDDS